MDAKSLMRLAIVEARKGGRATRPNPQVGAVALTRDGILLTGYHARVGEAHAEKALISEAKARGISLEGSTWAVTLEPCSHHGRTGPCADALIKEGIKKISIGSRDPFPQVNGRGLERLRAAGIEVEENVLKDDCEALNHEWLTAHRQGLPYIRVKMAVSLDGLWASESGESQWITGPEARARGHELRARSDALITGRGTVEHDDPSFTARLENGGPLEGEWQPKVWVLSRERKTDFVGKKLAVHPRGAESAVVAPGQLRAFLGSLLESGVTQVLVEAGPTLTHSFLSEGLFNELIVFKAPKILGGNGARLPAFLEGSLPGLTLKLLGAEALGESGDLMLRYAPALT